MLADLRLYQLVSPSLPVGALLILKGLEWAIEKRLGMLSRNLVQIG